MAINTHLTTIESKKKPQKNRNRLIVAENILMVAKWEALREWLKKVKGLRSTNWLLQNSHGIVKSSIGNIVNNI